MHLGRSHSVELTLLQLRVMCPLFLFCKITLLNYVSQCKPNSITGDKDKAPAFWEGLGHVLRTAT